MGLTAEAMNYKCWSVWET